MSAVSAEQVAPPETTRAKSEEKTMNQPKFEVMTRPLSRRPARRDVLRGLAGAGLGGLLTRQAGDTLAKKSGKGKSKGKNRRGKKGKVRLCHEGQTITVSKS